jgi:hypothetical protein
VTRVGLGAACAVAALAACDAGGPTAAGSPANEFDGGTAAAQSLDLALCSGGAGFTLASVNPYFPMAVGTRWTYEGDEDGEAVELQITVLDETRTIEGVTTRVIEEREWIDDELVEVSWNYYAQTSAGTVCYFGEDVDIFEEGGIAHEGAWCASDAGSHAGIFLPGDPRPGMKFPMELAPGVAEDEGTIVGSGPLEVPAGEFEETIRVREYNPLDGDKGYKVFAEGVGMILDGPAELLTVESTDGTPDGPIPTDQTCGV